MILIPHENSQSYAGSYKLAVRTLVISRALENRLLEEPNGLTHFKPELGGF